MAESDLTAFQAWILAFRMLGLTQEEIAEKLKSERRNINKAEGIARTKVKKASIQ
jgi:transcriptional regulator